MAELLKDAVTRAYLALAVACLLLPPALFQTLLPNLSGIKQIKKCIETRDTNSSVLGAQTITLTGEFEPSGLPMAVVED